MTGDAPRPIIQVACGALINAQGEVLIAQRPPGKIAAGKWEFPGGKIERGESPHHALVRELEEELAVRVCAARPLIRIRHDYSDRTVILHTWLVTAFDGIPHGREQQAFAWVRPDRLSEWDLLAADGPIVNALRLPQHYVFTPPQASLAQLQGGLAALPAGALLRLRQPELTEAEYAQRVDVLLPACRERGLRLLLDRSPEMAMRYGAHGWHATEAALQRLKARPLPAGFWFAASVHDGPGLLRARQCGADFAVLGNVGTTATHPGRKPLGWTGFADQAAEAGLPVFAIGGVGPAQLGEAFNAGAQGVAGISAYWAAS